jgi:hypothetical protein
MTRIALRSSLVFAVLLALPSVAASGTAGRVASFEAEAATWDGSQDEQGGSLVAFMQQSTRPPLPATSPAAQVEGGMFRLEAGTLKVESDTSAVDAEVDGSVSVSSPASHEASEYSQATVIGTEAREGQAFFVFPAGPGSATAIADCGEGSAGSGTVQAVSQLAARPAISADVSQAVEVRPCDGSEQVFQGDFVVVLWQHDAALDAVEGHADLWSGKRQQDSAPDPTGAVDGRPFVSKARQTYLVATDATLRLPAVASRSPRLYTESVPLGAAESVVLSQATGRVAATDLHGESVRLEGDLVGSLRRSADRLGLEVTSGVQAVAVDGKPIELSIVQTGGPDGFGPSWVWLAGAGVLGLVAAPALLVPVARRRGAVRRHHVRSLLDRAEDDCGRLRFANALAAVESVLSMDPRNGEAVMLQARAIECLGGDGERLRLRALDLLLQAGESRLAACNALEAAVHAAEQDSDDRVRRWLAMIPATEQQHALDDVRHCGVLERHLPGLRVERLAS